MPYEYYEYLSIERTASTDEIKRAYKKKAMELHPDRHGGDKTKEAEFKKVNEAYATLSDPEKKAHYDRFGSSEGMGGFGGFGGGFQGGFDASDLGDIFSSFFGGGFGGQRGKKADIRDDIEIRMNISLEDALYGNTRKIEFQRRSICSSCDGKGGKTETCPHCQGKGQIREQIRTVFGVMEQARPCHHCDGTGEHIIEKCPHCHGKRHQTVTIKKDIEIPLGIEDGMSIKIRGEGHEGRDGNGDLYVSFSVPEKEGGLVRDGHMLHYTVRISPAEAALGTEKDIDIPIIGKKKLSIPHGTQNGDTFKFAHEGFSRLDHRGAKGDLIIHFTIDIPTKLSHDEKKLYTALLELQGGKKIEKGFFENIFS